MTRPDRSTQPPETTEPAHDTLTSSDPKTAAPADPLALDPLSPIVAPDRRWFVPAHGRY